MKISILAVAVFASTSLVSVTAADNSSGVIPSTVSGTYHIGPNYTFDEALDPCNDDDCERGHNFTFYMPYANTSYNCDPADNPSLANLTTCVEGDGSYCGCADGYCGKTEEPRDARKISVYVPAAYEDGDEVAVLVLQDGQGFNYPNSTTLNVFTGISNVMDRFIGSEDENRSLPTFILVAVDPAGPTSFGGGCSSTGDGVERSNEYATVSDKYAKFVSEEVLPFVTTHPDVVSKYPNLTITDDPDGRATLGTSFGGAAAFKMAFLTPELFRIAITYSAGLVENFFDPPLESKEEHPLGMAEFWSGQELIKNHDLKPIRISLAGCDMDLGTPSGCVLNPSGRRVDANATFFNVTMGYGPYDAYDFLVANNKTEEALAAKEYETRYAYGTHCCHSDPYMFYQDIPNTLVWAFRPWMEKAQENDASEIGKGHGSTTIDEEPIGTGTTATSTGVGIATGVVGFGILISAVATASFVVLY